MRQGVTNQALVSTNRETRAGTSNQIRTSKNKQTRGSANNQAPATNNQALGSTNSLAPASTGGADSRDETAPVTGRQAAAGWPPRVCHMPRWEAKRRASWEA
jgi:hypothetical protein